MTRDQIKKSILDSIEDENGIVPLDENDLLRKAELDSFGHTVVFLDLDAKFGYFKEIDGDPFVTINWDTITIKEMIDRIEQCI